MLSGSKVRLRARIETDVPVLHAEIYDDVAGRSRSDSRPWRPVSAGSASPYAVGDPRPDAAPFSVVRLDDDALAGDALLWGIDQHNRVAHIGISLRPAFRGGGLGTDTVQVLCRYGFAVLGLQRLQIETLADNPEMLRTATKVGFVEEGRLRRSAWVTGEFIDEIILGLLSSEWHDD